MNEKVEWDHKKHIDFRHIILQNLVATAFLTVLGPMGNELSHVFSVGTSDIGLINAFFLMISGGFSFIWALYADKNERKRLLIICSLIWSTCSLLTIFSINYLMLFILQVTGAIGFGGLLPISFSLIIDLTVPQKRSYTLGMLQMCITLGSGLGLLLGGILIDFLPWWTPYLIISIMGFISIYFIFQIDEPQRGSLDSYKKDSELSTEVTFTINKGDLTDIFKIKSNNLIVLYTLVKSLCVGAVNFYFVMMMQDDHGFSSSTATILMVLIFSVQIVGAPVIGKLADGQFKKRKTGKADVLTILLATGPIFYILGFSVVFTLNDLSLFILFLVMQIIAAFILSADMPVAQSILSDVDPPRIRSTILSVLNISSTLGQSLGVMALGQMHDTINISYSFGYVILSIVLMGSVLFLIPLRKTVLSDLSNLELRYKNENKININ
ncbi:MAG: MFS transporter [archaeon]|nr:MFS transporter [archaeon]